MRDLEVEVLETLDQTPCHVYDLKYLLEARQIDRNHSDLYKLMKSLEKRELVSHQTVPSKKGPDRKRYALTDKGRQSLDEAERGGLLLLYRKYLGQVARQVQEHLASELEIDRVPMRTAVVMSPAAVRDGDPYVAVAWAYLRGTAENYLIDNGEGARYAAYTSLSADLAHLPFPDGHLDVLFAPNLSLAEVEPALDECSRVLAPEGQLFTVLPFATEALDTSMLLEFLVGRIREHYPHVAPWSRIDFTRELDAFFHVTVAHHRECSLFICRKDAL
jgi:DNA-binding PadR family transcriptional regulator